MKIKLLPTVSRWNPANPRHDWVKKIRHLRNCGWCEMAVRTNPDDWSLSWSWPAEPRRVGGTTFQGNPLPVCTGPRPGRGLLLGLVDAGAVSSTIVDGEVRYEADGRQRRDATDAIGRAVHDGLVYLFGEQYPQPGLTDLGERWLRVYRELQAARERAA